MTSAPGLRIAHLGTYDVANYGDLLFPSILEWRLAELGAEIVHISPVGGPPVMGSCPPVMSYAQAVTENFDAVVVGGGNIVYGGASVIPKYRENAEYAYPSLWLGAAEIAHRSGCPLIFNAPGVRELGATAGRIARLATNGAAYLAVRDAYSRDLLEPSAAVVPDTALEVARMWPNPAASSDLLGDSQRTIALHCSSRFATAQEAAVEFDRLAREADATAALIPIGPCHGDDLFLAEVADLMMEAHVVLQPEDLQHVAAAIRRSSCYVGSSMHGFITACSYGIPAVALAGGSKPSHKFSGFAAQVGTEALVVRSFSEAHPSDCVIDVGSALERLDEHWHAVVEAIRTGRSDISPLIRSWRLLLRGRRSFDVANRRSRSLLRRTRGTQYPM